MAGGRLTTVNGIQCAAAAFSALCLAVRFRAAAVWLGAFKRSAECVCVCAQYTKCLII